ncbi:MAG: hypothetical protein K0S74_1166 [Chlamydiales bacterium]|jgi:hypothetical protein|nr:hypothetical protein [Chlamydiales bacterium]
MDSNSVNSKKVGDLINLFGGGVKPNSKQDTNKVKNAPTDAKIGDVRNIIQSSVSKLPGLQSIDKLTSPLKDVKLSVTLSTPNQGVNKKKLKRQDAGYFKNEPQSIEEGSSKKLTKTASLKDEKAIENTVQERWDDLDNSAKASIKGNTAEVCQLVNNSYHKVSVIKELLKDLLPLMKSEPTKAKIVEGFIQKAELHSELLEPLLDNLSKIPTNYTELKDEDVHATIVHYIGLMREMLEHKEEVQEYSRDLRVMQKLLGMATLSNAKEKKVKQNPYYKALEERLEQYSQNHRKSSQSLSGNVDLDTYVQAISQLSYRLEMLMNNYCKYYPQLKQIAGEYKELMLQANQFNADDENKDYLENPKTSSEYFDYAQLIHGKIQGFLANSNKLSKFSDKDWAILRQNLELFRKLVNKHKNAKSHNSVQQKQLQGQLKALENIRQEGILQRSVASNLVASAMLGRSMGIKKPQNPN